MAQPARKARRQRFELRNSWSLWRAGLRGRSAFVTLHRGDTPRLAFRGAKSGRVEFPVNEIVRLRAGKEMLRYNSLYRCLLWRRGHGSVSRSPMAPFICG